MSIRETDFRDGTKLRLKGNDHEGKIGVDLQGFDFDRAVTQNEIIELNPEDCSAIDLRYGNVYKINLTDDIPSFALLNGDIGTYLFIFEQDSIGGRNVTFGTDFYFPSGVNRPNYILDSAGTINIVTFLCDKTNFYGTYMDNFVNA